MRSFFIPENSRGVLLVHLFSVFEIAGQIRERVNEQIEKIDDHDAESRRQSRADRGEKEGAQLEEHIVRLYR